MEVDVKLNIGTFVLLCVIGGLSVGLVKQTRKVIALEKLTKATENS